MRKVHSTAVHTLFPCGPFDVWKKASFLLEEIKFFNQTIDNPT